MKKIQNIDYKKIVASNKYDDNTNCLVPWDNNKKDYIGNHGIVDIPKITYQSKKELDHSKNILINEGNEEQIQNTPSYSHKESTGHSFTLETKISTTIDVDALIEDTKISAEISASGTWNDIVTNTYTANSQPVKVPPHSQIDVDYYFYQTVDKVDTLVYQNYNLNQIIYFSNDYCYIDGNIVNTWFNEINSFKNIDWIFNIPNGYIKKYDGNYFVKTLPISYIGIGTYFKSIDGPAKPYPKTK